MGGEVCGVRSDARVGEGRGEGRSGGEGANPTPATQHPAPIQSTATPEGRMAAGRGGAVYKLTVSPVQRGAGKMQCNARGGACLSVSRRERCVGDGKG